MVFSLAGVQRAYARLVVDQKSGRETWLRTELKGGLPTRVNEALLVKPSTDAGFGSVKQASRIWQSAYDLSAPTQLFLHFYRDGTGERVVQNLDDGFEQRSPLNWQFVGSNIQFTRFVGSIKLDRYWEPLRDGLGRDKWVMESEFLTDPNGNVNPTFKLRVNLFADRGKAVPPTKR